MSSALLGLFQAGAFLGVAEGFPAFLSCGGSTEAPSARKHFPLSCRAGLLSRGGPGQHRGLGELPYNVVLYMHEYLLPLPRYNASNPDTQALSHPAVAGDVVLNIVILFNGSPKWTLRSKLTKKLTPNQTNQPNQQNPPNTPKQSFG